MDASHEADQQPKQIHNQIKNDASIQYWEYKVIHININIQNVASAQPSTPEADSKKLQGALSPEFIKREFPKMYKHKSQKTKHPAAQLELFLNSLGKERWELVETSQVGELLMFFFKRLILKQSALANGQEE